MKKTFSMVLAMVLAVSFSAAFSGCGSNSPGNKVLEVLNSIGKGDWSTVYDKLQIFSKYTDNKELYVAQMAEYGKPLVEFLKDAKLNVDSEIFEKEWSFEGNKFSNVTRVTVRMEPGQTKEWPAEFPFAVSLGQTLQCECLYTDEKDNSGVIINMGNPPQAFWVWLAKNENEYSSPAPIYVVSDPDPENQGSPAVASFYWIFDEKYSGKYVAVPVETYTKTIVVAINPENGTVAFVKQVLPEPAMEETAFMEAIFKPYEMTSVTADSIATFTLLPNPEPAYNEYAKKVREAVAQVLKLYTIHKMGSYGMFHSKYPNGLLSVRKGSKIELPPGMIDTKERSIVGNTFYPGGKTAFIKVSSCGTCQSKALELIKELGIFGLPQDRIILVSSSTKDKLVEFEKKIGNAHLVIDDKGIISLSLMVNTTPSMVIVDKNQKVLVFMESKDLENGNALKRELNEAF